MDKIHFFFISSHELRFLFKKFVYNIHMIKKIVKDSFFLSRKCAPAGSSDLDKAKDLIDTLQANRAVCVGMAANMIGVQKQIIAISAGPVIIVMLNPKIIKHEGPYQTKEGCLSLSGQRPCTRYRKITVVYQDMRLDTHTSEYTDTTAEIIQHEIDHCSGILI